MNLCEQTALYFYGELPEAERAAYKAHLAGCPACRARLALLARTQEALAVPSAPQKVMDGLLARTSRKRVSVFRRKMAWAFGAAAVLLCVCSGAFVGGGAYDRQETLAYLSVHMDEEYAAFAGELAELENDF